MTQCENPLRQRSAEPSLIALATPLPGAAPAARVPGSRSLLRLRLLGFHRQFPWDPRRDASCPERVAKPPPVAQGHSDPSGSSPLARSGICGKSSRVFFHILLERGQGSEQPPPRNVRELWEKFLLSCIREPEFEELSDV